VVSDSGTNDKRIQARRRLPPVRRACYWLADSGVSSTEIVVGGIRPLASDRAWKIRPTMATTTTRLRAVGTCNEKALSSVEGKMPQPLSLSLLRNGLTSRDVDSTGKINGYTLTSNGHVSKQSEPACRTVRFPRFPWVLLVPFAASQVSGDRPVIQVASRYPFSSISSRDTVVSPAKYMHRDTKHETDQASFTRDDVSSYRSCAIVTIAHIYSLFSSLQEDYS